MAAASDPKTAREVLDYLVSPENLRPKLLPALLENPSVPESELAKFAISASPETIATMLQSARVRALAECSADPSIESVLEARSRRDELLTLLGCKPRQALIPAARARSHGSEAADSRRRRRTGRPLRLSEPEEPETFMKKLSPPISPSTPRKLLPRSDKPFQPIGGIVELLGADYFPVIGDAEDIAAPAAEATPAGCSQRRQLAKPPLLPSPPLQLPACAKRENTLQKINHLDVKGRIQLALEGKQRRALDSDSRRHQSGGARGAGSAQNFGRRSGKICQPEKCAGGRAAADSAQAALHEELHCRAESGGEPAHAPRSRPGPDEESADSGS